MSTPARPAVIVTRDDHVESSHLAHVVIVDVEGTRTVLSGSADAVVYPRSALKPFQALAVLDLLESAGRALTTTQLAVACASHTGGDDAQVEAASLLAEADLDESALACPADWPADVGVRQLLKEPTALSHNCSGKHAAMLLAHTVSGGSAATYLSTDNSLQQRVAERIAALVGERPTGPGVDGCGAPAWRCTLGGVATGFSRLAAGSTGADPVDAVRQAMSLHPQLVGGPGLVDTSLMWSDVRVIAKRGAEGVMAAGFLHPDHGPLGVAVKVLDGGDRAAGPLMATVLHALGASVPDGITRPAVLGGGVPHGAILAAPHIAARTTNAFGLS